MVDVSGSMITAGRSRLAKAATAAVIDTLEWKDGAWDENPWLGHAGTQEIHGEIATEW